MTRVCAFDPGLTGGIAIYDGEDLLIEEMPISGGEIDPGQIERLLRIDRIDAAFVEKVSSRPGQGVRSVFRFGEGYGLIKGVLSAMKIPTHLVTPQSWMKEIHAGCSGVDTKAKSAQAAARLFPGVDFRVSERARNPHMGMCEAALIALYGYRKLRR